MSWRVIRASLLRQFWWSIGRAEAAKVASKGDSGESQGKEVRLACLMICRLTSLRLAIVVGIPPPLAACGQAPVSLEDLT